jgi:protocatechuate 3,4-dioxygenase beta subunit
MTMSREIKISRRRLLLVAAAAFPAAVGLLPRGGAEAGELPPTRACSDKGDPTPPQMAGPYFKPRSPERASLLTPGTKGTKIVLTGVVLSTICQPVPGGLLDFWQCDSDGNYDTTGYALRGHQFTDADGRYRLETIVPAVYPGRTRHIHVRVQAPNQPVLTTQLYFPGEPGNDGDFLFRRDLLMAIQEQGNAKVARFDFVLKPG